MKNNLINSCFLEIFQFINKNNIKKLIKNIMDVHYDFEIDNKYWNFMKEKYDQYEDKNNNEEML